MCYICSNTTLSDIIDAVEVGLVVLIKQILPLSIQDLQRLSVVQAERRSASVRAEDGSGTA